MQRPPLLLYFLTSQAFLSSAKASTCDKGLECDTETTKCPTHDIVQLKPLEDEWTARPKVFFIESSGRPHLLPRQACSVESCARSHAPDHGHAPLPAVVILTADHLSLADNTTCQLYRAYAEELVFFRTVDTREAFSGTPLESVRDALEDSPTRAVHLSDALRLLLVYNYGGWYSDVDMVFLKSMSNLPSNVISGDHSSEEELRVNPIMVGRALNNAIFHFEKGNAFIEKCLEEFAQSFQNTVRLSGGPLLMTNVLLDMCGFSSPIAITTDVFTLRQCQNSVQVLPQSYFYPIGWFEYTTLYESRKTDEEWEKLVFGKAFAVHMYNSSKETKKKILKPRFYGAARPAYLYLALKQCPMSFHSEKTF